MMKQEFEQRIDAEVTPEEYKVVEHVYMWHPAIPNVGGKDMLAQIWKLGGMDLIEDMDCRATSREAEYLNICDKIQKTVEQKRIILDRMSELQKQLNKLSEEFDILTAQTEELHIRKKAFDRGN